MLDFQINRQIRSYVQQKWIRVIARIVSRDLGLRSQHHFSLVLVDDNKIRQLNKQYRNKDKVTDVLSFANNQSNNFIDPLIDKDYLGEIIISIPQARRQAKQLEHSFKKEISRLTIHGIAHLCGYDHENVSIKKRRAMVALEEQIITKLKI